jgi:hypothetical protein
MHVVGTQSLTGHHAPDWRTMTRIYTDVRLAYLYVSEWMTNTKLYLLTKAYL